jgi:hypothetical protein
MMMRLCIGGTLPESFLLLRFGAHSVHFNSDSTTALGTQSEQTDVIRTAVDPELVSRSLILFRGEPAWAGRGIEIGMA